MSLNTQIFTDAGINMLGAANAGQLLTITKIVVGQGVANVGGDIYPLTALIDKKADVAITRKVDLGGGKMLISGVLNEANLPPGAAFPLRELGVMAQVGALGAAQDVGAHIPSVPGGSGISQTPGKMTNIGSADDAAGSTDAPSPQPLAGAEQLYCAGNVFTDPPDTVTPGGTSSHAFDITIIIDRATNVTIVIGDATTVDCENIPTDPLVGPGWYAQRVGNIFQFKRAVEGAGIDLTETADRVTIAIKQLSVNVDLYVPANHPQCPSPDVGFASVQLAHDYLLQFTIPTNKFATIHIYDGVFSGNVPINISHPDAKQISLIGSPRVDKNVSAVTYVSQSAKTATIAAGGNTTGLTSGRRCYLYGGETRYVGGCRVTAAPVGLNVSLSQIKKDTAAPLFTGAGGASRLSYFPTVIVNTDTTNRQVPTLNCPNGIKQIENICFEGFGYILNLGDAILKNVQVIGGSSVAGAVGRAVNGSGLISLVGENVFSAADFGLNCLNVLTAFDQTVVNGCGAAIQPAGSGMAIGSIITGQTSAIVYLIHNQWGVLAAIGANFRGGSIFYSSNDVGFAAQSHSVILLGAAYGSVPTGNNLDLYAQGLSYIEYNRWQQANPSCNPTPAETVGNQESLIHVLNSTP